MKPSWTWAVLFLFAGVQIGCVTQTERIPYHRYYDSPENESILDELRREFGWQKPPPWIQEEPLYKRAARGVKETVTAWFQQETPASTTLGGFQSMQELQRAQQEAIEQLQQQKLQAVSPDRGPNEGTQSGVSPEVSGSDLVVPQLQSSPSW